MWVYDRETLRFLAVNEAAVRHYGYSREEFQSMTVVDIRPEEEQPRLREEVRDIEGYRFSGRWKLRKKDGSIVNVEILSHDMPFAERPARVVLANDVTERLAAEEGPPALVRRAQGAVGAARVRARGGVDAHRARGPRRSRAGPDRAQDGCRRGRARPRGDGRRAEGGGAEPFPPWAAFSTTRWTSSTASPRSCARACSTSSASRRPSSGSSRSSANARGSPAASRRDSPARRSTGRSRRPSSGCSRSS